MLKKLDKYILKEIIPPFFLGLSVYSFTMLLNHIQQIADDIVVRGTSLWTSIKILLHLLPFILSYTIPMSVLMGVLAGLSRMSTDSEIIALKTMGIRNSRIFKPIFLFSLIAFIVSAFMGMYITPPANYELGKLMSKVYLSKNVTNIRPQTICNEFGQYILYFESKNNSSNTWENVLLYPIDSGNDENILLAKTGKLSESQISDSEEKEYCFHLTDVTLHRFNREENAEDNYGIAKSDEKNEPIRSNLNHKIHRRTSHKQFPELLNDLKTKPGNRLILQAIYGQLTQPLSALALAFLGLSLGISTKKGGKSSGFVVSLGVLFLYYTLFTSGDTLIKKKIISPFIGMWGPLFILVIIGIILYYRTSREKSLNWEKISSFLNQFKIKFEKIKVKFSINEKKNLFSRSYFKVLDIYIIQKIIYLFVLFLLSILAIFFIMGVIENIDDAIDNNVSIIIVLKYVLHKIPDYMGFITSIAALTAVLISFSIMSKNNEIIALQSNGISIYRLVIPTIIFGILLSLGFFLFQETVIPPSNEIASQLFSKIRGRENISKSTTKRGIKAGKGKFYFYKFYKPEKSEFERFNVILLNDKFQIKKRIFAKTANWKNDHELILQEGFIKEFKDQIPTNHQSFDKYIFEVSETISLFETEKKFSTFMNIKELREYIKYLKLNQTDATKYLAKMYYKYSFPFSSLVMILIAIPFSFQMGKKGTLHGIGIAIGISMIYWWLSAFCNSLGQTALISPFIAAFAPLLLFLSFSIVLFFVLNK